MSEENKNKNRELVYTIRNRCRVCYTCVRECPAKAIKIINGQAEVLNERCIACGNCIKVCSQGAKIFLDTKEHFDQLMSSGKKNIAIVAPSFPAEFSEIPDYKQLVSMIRMLGFEVVSEVAFGADLVARKYNELIQKNGQKRYISSDCPGIVKYIERYHPELVDNLAPIASPMVAMARVMKQKYGQNTNVIFIGPCIAKKSESNEVDEMITFLELRELFQQKEIEPGKQEPSDFDPPKSGRGAIFPVSRGLLQTAGIKDDVFDGNIIVAEGRNDFQEAIKEFEHGHIKSRHLELLCCEGCIVGPGTSKEGRQYGRRILVHNYVQEKSEKFNKEEWKAHVAEFKDLDLTAAFEPNDKRISTPTRDEIDEVLRSMGKTEAKDKLNCGACGYDTCEEHAIAIVKGLAENEMCLPFTIEKLHNSVQELAVSNEKLVSMQQALRQSEKMASMGQLSAGIAHELNNPLGVVIMYANILLDEVEKDSELHDDLKLIVDQTNRCKKIVGGLLNFARKNQVSRTEIDTVKLIDQSFDTVIVPDNVKTTVQTENLSNRKAYLDQEQMTQIFTNLIKNAIDAMPDGGKLTVEIEDDENYTIFHVSDTGKGIKPEDKDKIFEPFYTTKGIGKGTGLGLATAYGIVKMHKGKITVDSNTNPEAGSTGTTFTIKLPKYQDNSYEG
jgi:iron only hydrogenase large subunit-like protein/nitrogen-specific signal transduction histidine kinase